MQNQRPIQMFGRVRDPYFLSLPFSAIYRCPSTRVEMDGDENKYSDESEKLLLKNVGPLSLRRSVNGFDTRGSGHLRQSTDYNVSE